jgi:hypothetical protein
MTRDSDNAERRPGRARIVTRRSFPRPGWTCVTRTRRPANSLKVQPRSWRRRRARPSSSTRSAGYLRCDRAAGVALSLDESSSAPGAARRRARWRGCYRPGRRAAVPAQKAAACAGVATTSSPTRKAPGARHDAPTGTSARGRLGRVGIGQRMRVRRVVPSRNAEPN